MFDEAVFLPTALWNDRDEFLHRAFWSVTCSWCIIVIGMGSCFWAADRETEKYEHRGTEKVYFKHEKLNTISLDLRKLFDLNIVYK